MKTLFKKRILTMVLAIVAGVTIAFTSKAAKSPTQSGVFIWTGMGPNGEGVTIGDVFHAEDFYGCEGGGAVCATGVNTRNPTDVILIRYNP